MRDMEPTRAQGLGIFGIERRHETVHRLPSVGDRVVI